MWSQRRAKRSFGTTWTQQVLVNRCPFIKPTWWPMATSTSSRDGKSLCPAPLILLSAAASVTVHPLKVLPRELLFSWYKADTPTLARWVRSSGYGAMRRILPRVMPVVRWMVVWYPQRLPTYETWPPSVTAKHTTTDKTDNDCGVNFIFINETL